MKHFIPFILIILYLIGDFSLLNEKNALCTQGGLLEQFLP